MSNFQDFGKIHSVDMDEVIGYEWVYSGVMVLGEEQKLAGVKLLIKGGILIEINNKEAADGVRTYYEHTVKKA